MRAHTHIDPTSFDWFLWHILYPWAELAKTLHHAFVHCKFLSDTASSTTLLAHNIIEPADLVPTTFSTTGSERQHGCDVVVPVLRHTGPDLVISKTRFFTPVM